MVKIWSQVGYMSFLLWVFFATTLIQIAPKFDHKLDLGSFGMAIIQIALKFSHKLDLGPFGDNPCPV
jgi:hypothetical protein